MHWRKDFKLGFEEEEENLIFLAFFSLNPYQSEVNNILQMINSFNFMLDEGLCKIMIM